MLESLFYKDASLQACNAIKKETPTQGTPTQKFLRTPILKHICERLHLCIDYSIYIDFYNLLKGYFQNLDPDPEKRGKRLDVEK